MCLHAVEKYEKVEGVNTQNDYATTSKKNEQIKRKQICSLWFVNKCKFQENKFKIVQNNFLGKNNINTKRSPAKATDHNDH